MKCKVIIRDFETIFYLKAHTLCSRFILRNAQFLFLNDLKFSIFGPHFIMQILQPNVHNLDNVIIVYRSESNRRN